MTFSSIKPNRPRSRNPSVSIPIDRNAQGASGEARADLLDTRTAQVMNGTDQLHFCKPREHQKIVGDGAHDVHYNWVFPRFVRILLVLTVHYLDSSFSRKDPTQRVALRRILRLGFRLRADWGMVVNNIRFSW